MRNFVPAAIFSLSALLWISSSDSLAAQPPQSGNATSISSNIRIPMQLQQGLPMVQVRINGAGPYKFLLDTGSVNSHISARLANQLGLRATPLAGMGSDAAGRGMGYSMVRLQSLEMGGLRFDNCWATVPAGGNMQAGPAAIDGILGFSMFTGKILTLDFPNKQLLVGKGRLGKADGKNILANVGQRFSPTVKTTIAGQNVTLLVDTGHNGWINLPATLAGKLSFTTAHQQSKSWVMSGYTSSKRARLDGDARIGKYTLVKPMVGWHVGTGGSALLGTAALQNFAVTFDMENNTVRLKQKI